MGLKGGALKATKVTLDTTVTFIIHERMNRHSSVTFTTKKLQIKSIIQIEISFGFEEDDPINPLEVKTKINVISGMLRGC